MSGDTSILEMVTFRNGTLTKKCSLRRFNIIVATQQRILTLPLKTIKPMGRFNIIVATQQRILTLPLKTIKPMGFICPRGSTQHKGEFIPCERLGTIQNQSCNKPISKCYVIQFYTFFFWLEFISPTSHIIFTHWLVIY